MMIKKLFSIFFLINLLIVIVIVCLLSENYLILLNIQIAFASSFIISISTFYSYKKNIDKNLEEEILRQNNDLDYTDKIDDPYDLYSENIAEINIENPSKEDIQNAMKPIKQNYFNNFKKTILSYTSFYRIFSYILLISGFFYLNNNNILHVYSYLFGFILLPLTSFLLKKGLK